MFHPNKIIKNLAFIFGVIALSLSLSYAVLAVWQEPALIPPDGNVAAPLNIGAIGQTKIGGLILNTGGAATGLIVQSGNVGIGTATPASKLHLQNGTFVIDNPSLPTLTGTYNTSGNALGVYVSGKYAYVADGASGLQIIDISNPASPSLTGTYDTSDEAVGVYVSGKYAYVADGYSGLQIIDVSNPASPTLTGTYYTSGWAWDVYVSGKYAYMADVIPGLQIIDISNPASPFLTGTYNTSGAALGVYVSGKYAYVADWEYGLQIIDISNPASPSLTGTYDTIGVAIGVYVSGKYVYVAVGGDGGLQIIDISNPASPSLTGTYNTSGNAWGIYVSGKYAYVGDYGSGLQIIDISNPASPSLTGTYDTSGGAWGVYVSGKYVYVADRDSGLQIIDIKGADIHALSAGNINTNALTVWENIDVGNNLYVRNGLNVGPGGILTDGRLSVSGISYFGGNVGIGTTGPGQKLTVAGTIESTSGGFKFPDGSVQDKAASGGGTLVVTAPTQFVSGNSNNTASCLVSCPAGYTAMICEIKTAPTPPTCGCEGCDRNELNFIPSSCSAYVDSGNACAWIWCSTKLLCGKVQ
ncbi:hypothetical protein KJ636_04785 [Patescibacteria group bacterium]|nr:hypothetical protein [Patescibacteria group bacterium]